MNNSRFTDPDKLRRKINTVNHTHVDGGLFIDVLLTGLNLKTAAVLGRAIQVAPAIFSRIRTGRAVSDEMLLRLHDVFQLPISGLKDLLRHCTHTGAPADMARIDALASVPMFIGVSKGRRDGHQP